MSHPCSQRRPQYRGYESTTAYTTKVRRRMQVGDGPTSSKARTVQYQPQNVPNGVTYSQQSSHANTGDRRQNARLHFRLRQCTIWKSAMLRQRKSPNAHRTRRRRPFKRTMSMQRHDDTRLCHRRHENALQPCRHRCTNVRQRYGRTSNATTRHRTKGVKYK